MSVLSTLLYHSIFDYPLNIEELHHYLISDKQVSVKALKKEIENLLKAKKISQWNDFFLPSTLSPQPLALVSLRLRRQKISAKKLTIARRAAKTISIIPWIKMVAVTGALAMENTDENDDIDLMVVTSKNRLWIVRPLATILVSIFFKRRRHSNSVFSIQNSELKNAVCLNLWLDKSALAIPVDQRNLYTAHELAQMKPVVNKDGTYEKMMWGNRWGMKYLANAWERFEGWQVNRLKRSNNFHAFDLFSLLNFLAFNLQFQFMKSKMTNERVSIHSAFFHPVNRTDTILSEYDRLCHRNF
ncbi:hypothetical protein HZB78_01895 [Candidatus Collierbacteria bacterium]|nr:hypothetical protein [Candidatus Collierbacteria bacterium]